MCFVTKTYRAYHDGGFGNVDTWFDYDQNACRVLPSVLLPMIRKYFPRSDDGSVKYPPPFTTDGGPGGMNNVIYPYPLEYVNLVGEYARRLAINLQFVDHLQLSSHPHSTTFLQNS